MSLVSPAMFDHVLFGIHDLQAGIDLIKEKTGIDPIRGGCYPNAGTCNAQLLSTLTNGARYFTKGLRTENRSPMFMMTLRK